MRKFTNMKNKIVIAAAVAAVFVGLHARTVQAASGVWGVMLFAGGYAMVTTRLGSAAGNPAPGDYGGDGKTDPALYQAASGQWTALLSASGYAPVVWQ